MEGEECGDGLGFPEYQKWSAYVDVRSFRLISILNTSSCEWAPRLHSKDEEEREGEGGGEGGDHLMSR